MQYTVMESEGGGPGEWMASRWESHVSGGKRANVIDRSSRSLSLYSLPPLSFGISQRDFKGQ